MSGSSQDELVMMEMIEKDYNCSFLVRDSSSIKISMRGIQETYEILQVFEFTSDRKMMSITVKNLADNKLINYSKGADNVMKTKLDKFGTKESDMI